MVGARISDYYEAEAKKEQIRSGKEYGKGGTKVVANLPQPLKVQPATKTEPKQENLDNSEENLKTSVTVNLPEPKKPKEPSS